MNGNCREAWIDWMRVCACFLVMIVHSTEAFYFGGEGTQVLSAADNFWVSFFEAISRACVPLFLVASSYVQFPIRYTTGVFFRRRAVRILIPFAVWSIVYALISGAPVQSFKDLLLNFNYSAGHLWFVYMLIGIYLIMPLLSPWAEKVGKKELQVYLGIWLFTTLIPFIREWATAGPLTVIEGRGGLPNLAYFPLWGEASWNAYGTFYYVSGMAGYLLLGLYFRRFAGEWSWCKTLCTALPLLAAGFAICGHGFFTRIAASGGGAYPVNGSIADAARWELPLYNDSLGTALTTIGALLLFRKLTSAVGFYGKIILPLSKAGYGMYLCHMIILARVCVLVHGWLGRGEAGLLGPVWTTPVEILLITSVSFLLTAIFSTLVQHIPKAGKYIIG